MIVFGMMMTSLCSQYWQAILAQGLTVGFGCACFFVPSVAIIPLYFDKRRALAMGVAAAGSSLGMPFILRPWGNYMMLIPSSGGVIYPILFHKLQPRVGFAWATRTIAFTMLASLALPLLSMKLRGETQSPKRGLDLSAWKEVSYTLFACSALFGFLGIYIPFFYVQLYALQQGIVNIDFVFYLLPLLNTGSLFGRLVGDHNRLQAYNQIILRLSADSSLYCR